VPVSKRLRFEILRRDNHSCRYCGRSAPEVRLTVDHVTPETLGGSDDPSNLVAACADCNAGKSSVPVDAALVADVAGDALRWAKAMAVATDLARKKRSSDNKFVADFARLLVDIYESDTARYELPPLPDVQDFKRSVLQFRDCGLDLSDLAFAARKAMSNRRLREEHIWRYLCGICWRTVEERQEIARSLLKADEADG
jgi:hypothetical protein